MMHASSMICLVCRIELDGIANRLAFLANRGRRQSDLRRRVSTEVVLMNYDAALSKTEATELYNASILGRSPVFCRILAAAIPVLGYDILEGLTYAKRHPLLP